MSRDEYLELCSLDEWPDDAGARNDVCWLVGLVKQFQETGDSIYAIKAIICAQDTGLRIPNCISAWQADVYREYLENEGSQSLDKLSKLSIGRGKDKALKKHRRDQITLYCPSTLVKAMHFSASFSKDLRVA